MKTPVLHETANSVPFTLSFVERLDKTLYQEAIESSDMVRLSYDPETQTSNIPLFAGTTATYDKSTTGVMRLSDDTEMTDT